MYVGVEEPPSAGGGGFGGPHPRTFYRIGDIHVHAQAYLPYLPIYLHSYKHSFLNNGKNNNIIVPPTHTHLKIKSISIIVKFPKKYPNREVRKKDAFLPPLGKLITKSLTPP